MCDTCGNPEPYCLVKPRPSQEDIDRDEMTTLGIEDLAELGRKRIREAVPAAVQVIRDVMEKDAFDQSLDASRIKLRFESAKYIIDRAFGSTSPTTGEFAGEKESKFTKFLAKSVVDYPDDDDEGLSAG